MNNPSLYALCVDDDRDNLRVLSYTLKLYHIAFKAVRAGSEALDLIRHEHFDFALIDIQMPGISGWQIAEAVRLDPDPAIRDIPLIAVTAHAMNGDRERILKAGYDGYISKPIDPGTFLQTLKSILEKISSTNISPQQGLND
jgi:CheY-like chemotaxis protein